MHRLTKLLFWISDILAWLLIAFSSLSAIAYPIAGPALARMDRQHLATSSIVFTCLLWLSVAVGAFLITRRRVLGLFLVIAPVFLTSSRAEWLASLVFATALALVFGLPFLLVLLRVRSATSEVAP